MPDARRILPIAKPFMGEEEAEAARRPIIAGWVTQGPEVEAFEAEFAAVVGAPHATAVSNCTTALHLALQACGVRPGDEVLTVSHSYIATANAVRHCGAIPVFVDVDPATYNMAPGQLADAFTPQTRAVMVVHQMGMPVNLAAILPLARAHGVPLVEDAACAIGSQWRSENGWESIGAPAGDVACFSFHPRKVLSTGDGGMITTRHAAWDRQFRLWRQHGMSISDSVRHSARQVTIESYPMLGYNYRMTDIQAAVGREQLKRLPVLLERRRFLADRYRSLLSDVSGVTPPHEPEWARSNFQSYCVRLDVGLDQLLIMQSLLDDGIATRRGIMCAHREEAYAIEPWRAAPGGLAESEKAQDQSILLPLFHTMTEADQEAVVDALRRAVARK
jgi:perosamine synthetase